MRGTSVKVYLARVGTRSTLVLGTRHLPPFLLVINYRARGAISLVVARVINVRRLGN